MNNVTEAKTEVARAVMPGYFRFLLCCKRRRLTGNKKIAHRPESLSDSYKTRLLLLFTTVGHDVVD